MDAAARRPLRRYGNGHDNHRDGAAGRHRQQSRCRRRRRRLRRVRRLRPPIDPATGTTDTIGKGFTELEDIEISPDGATYYLSERGGTIYAVAAPGGFEQASAPVLASGLGAVHQLAVTADGKTLYAIEYGPSDSLLSIDTASGR